MAWIEWRGFQAHLLPGRIRVRVQRVRHNAFMARHIEATLGHLPGIYQTTASAVTGSVLVRFNPQAISLEAIGIALQRSIADSTWRAPHVANGALTPVQEATRRVALTGGALALVALKRFVAGPSLLARSWMTYDMAGVVTVVAGYPYLRSGLQSLLRKGRVNGDMLIGAAGLALAIVRENVLSLAVLFVTSLNRLLAARMQEAWRWRYAIPDKSSTAQHDLLLIDRCHRDAARWGAWAKGTGLLVGGLSGDWRRALATLIAAAPSAIALAVPVPLTAAAMAATRRGVLVKGGCAMAAAGLVDTVLLPRSTLALVQCANRLSQQEMRQAVVDLHRMGLAVSVTDLSPQQLAMEIARLQAAGHTVALLSAEGADSPALSIADLGLLLVREGAPRSLEAADAILADGGVCEVVGLIQMGRRAQRMVQQNRMIAAAAHAMGLILTATGAVGPLGATVWHNLTSLGVLSNSHRLIRKWE